MPWRAAESEGREPWSAEHCSAGSCFGFGRSQQLAKQCFALEEGGAGQSNASRSGRGNPQIDYRERPTRATERGALLRKFLS